MVMTLYTIVPVLAVMGVSVYVLVLLIRALRKYLRLSLIHISEPTRRTPISYAVFCLKKKKK